MAKTDFEYFIVGMSVEEGRDIFEKLTLNTIHIETLYCTSIILLRSIIYYQVH